VCGRFHHHMPIYLVGVRFGDFFMWLKFRSFLITNEFTETYSDYSYKDLNKILKKW
jgi:hypothetical protein